MTASRKGNSLSSRSSSHAHLRRSRSDHGGREPNSLNARAALDRLLELIGRRGLSAAELRFLLRLVDREAGIPELAEALGQRPGDVWRSGRRLAARGLVRWHHVGTRQKTQMAITPAGLTTVQALLTAADRWLTPQTRSGSTSRREAERASRSSRAPEQHLGTGAPTPSFRFGVDLTRARRSASEGCAR